MSRWGPAGWPTAGSPTAGVGGWIKGKTADYIVHCRSGNRSGQAVVIMAELGFTGELINGGTLDEAAETTGAAIVK